MGRNGSEGIKHRVGDNIRRRRQVLKLSQDQVAEALGVTQAQVVKYEKGTSQLQLSKLDVLVKVLKTDANQLMGFDPQPPADLAPWAVDAVRNLMQISDPARQSIVDLIEALADLAP